jgi:hypothetical protein
MDVTSAGEVRGMPIGFSGRFFQVLEDGFAFFTEYDDRIGSFLNRRAGRFGFEKMGKKMRLWQRKDD